MAKFTVKHEFQSQGRTYEVGNSHDPAKLGVTEDSVARWYEAGFVDIDGLPPAPEPDPNRKVTIAPEKIVQHLRGKS